MGTGFSEVNTQPHRGGVWAAPGRLNVQSVCVLVQTGWPGRVGGGWVYLWSGLWPCTPHALETLAKFPPLQLHCGARPPRPGVVNPSEHGARKLNVFNAAPCLPRVFVRSGVADELGELGEELSRRSCAAVGFCTLQRAALSRTACWRRALVIAASSCGILLPCTLAPLSKRCTRPQSCSMRRSKLRKRCSRWSAAKDTSTAPSSK